MADTETTIEGTPTPTPKTEVYPDLNDGEDPEGKDYDLEQLALAEAEAAAEESGSPPAEPAAAPVDPAAPPATSAPAAAPAEPPADAADQQMVPHGRFHAVNEKLKQTERERDFYAGQAHAYSQQPAAQPPAAQPPAEPPPDFDAKRAEIRDKHREVARRYDSGEITFEEVEDSRDRTAAEIGEVDRVQRDQEAAAAAPAQPAQQPLSAGEAAQVFVQELGGAARLNADAVAVTQRHPYLAAISPADMPLIQKAVVKELADAGTPIIFDNSLAQTQRLREAIGAKMDVVGPVMYPQFDPKSVSQSSPAGGTPQPVNQPGLTPPAKARQDKLAMAAAHPPDTNAVGSQGGHVEVTEQQIESMTDEEIAALPPAIQEKFAL